MKENTIALFLLNSGKMFPTHRIAEMKAIMTEMTDQQLIIIQSLDYKDPNMIFVVSFMFGHWGIDRFLIGDTLLGVLKLFTCAGCFLWMIIDWFLIINRTKELNYQKFRQFAQDTSAETTF